MTRPSVITPAKTKPGAEEVLFGLVWLIPASIVRGFVLSKLWLWFVVSTFHINRLSIAAAIGIGLIVTMLTPTPARSKDTEYGAAWMAGVALTSLASPFFILFIGWVVLHFK